MVEQRGAGVAGASFKENGHSGKGRIVISRDIIII